MAEHEKVVDPTKVGLPPTPFFYTLDQVAHMLQLTEGEFIARFIWFLGRSTGRMSPRKIKAVNVAPEQDDAPIWRVSEGELIRWLKLIGVKIYSRGNVV